ncbi:hypothetical protein CLU79DRAFT_892395 [Phycomyces nitens]|nr:hypothetical protein CLU79DRAFT_892395 [Phycomyces nitens]
MQIFLAEHLKSPICQSACNSCQEEGHNAAVCKKTCKICKGSKELVDHLFFKCPKKGKRGGPQGAMLALEDKEVHPEEDSEHKPVPALVKRDIQNTYNTNHNYLL